MDSNRHHRRRIIWTIVAFLSLAWMRLSIGLENLIFYPDSLNNDPYAASLLENIVAIVDISAGIVSFLPVLCFSFFKLCTGLPLMIFSIGMVIYHSVKMGQLGGDQMSNKSKARKEKSKHG